MCFYQLFLFVLDCVEKNLHFVHRTCVWHHYKQNLPCYELKFILSKRGHHKVCFCFKILIATFFLR